MENSNEVSKTSIAVSAASSSFGAKTVVTGTLPSSVCASSSSAIPVSSNLFTKSPPFANQTGKPLTYTARMANRATPNQQNSNFTPNSSTDTGILDKRHLQDLVKEVDPMEQLDDDVEELMLQVADDFIDSVVTASAQLAKHRKANTIEVKDVQLHLERNWNMWIPGFGSEELRPYKKVATTEAHKQRMALIKKTLKKY